MKEFRRLLDAGEFPNTSRILEEKATQIAAEWTRRVLASEPSWWGRQAISKTSGGGGGFLIRKVPGGFQVYYANKGKYNYLAVIQKGRGSYDMKPGLLASPRARSGKNGRYIIVPFTKDKKGKKIGPSSEINSVITKVGSKKEPNADGKTVVRNKYGPYRKDPGMTGKGNIFASEQKNKNGSVSRSFVKFVIVTENSQGFFYPAIKAQNHRRHIMKSVNKAMKSEAVKKAIGTDAKRLISRMIKNSNK